jgi:hypothetical protein
MSASYYRRRMFDQQMETRKQQGDSYRKGRAMESLARAAGINLKMPLGGGPALQVYDPDNQYGQQEGTNQNVDPNRVPHIPVHQTGNVTDPYDRAAEAASYGRAKERTGMAMQAAMKGLRGSMARRGIGGSGIEAERTGGLYEAGLGQLGEADRTLAEAAAGRAYDSEQRNVDRRNRNEEYNADLDLQYENQRIDAQNRRMSLLTQIYGSFY